jgi:hypothetical protein
MRFFEFALFAALFLYAVSGFVKPGGAGRWLRFLPAMAGLLALVQVLAEGPRWQMAPAYLYTVLLFVLTLKSLAHPRDARGSSGRTGRRLPRILGRSLNALALLAAFLPPFLVPVFGLPNPSGPHAVGIRQIRFAAEAGVDGRAPDPATAPEMVMDIRYPAEAEPSGEPVRYWENAPLKSRIISKFWGGLPPFLFDHFSLIKTHSYPQARLSAGERAYPVLIFSHGSLGMPSLNTVLLEELASHGFLVVSISHTDYLPFLENPDGSIQAFDPDGPDLRAKMKENNDPDVQRAARQLRRSRTPADRERWLRDFLARNPENQKSLRRWVGEISLTIDALAKMNQSGEAWAGRLDLDRIGVLGVSFGGAASVEACRIDARCRAALSLDCPQFGDLIDKDMSQPVLFMASEQNQGLNDLFLQIKRNPMYLLTLSGTTHQNFSDLSIWGPLFRWQMLGRIDGRKSLAIQNAYVLAFFEKYLKAADNGLLDADPPPYPEARLESANIDGSAPESGRAARKERAWRDSNSRPAA